MVSLHTGNASGIDLVESRYQCFVGFFFSHSLIVNG
nr:MAG TPA: hypothetical protein [Caudoviricetes sp.]